MAIYTYDPAVTAYSGGGGTDTLVFNTGAANLTSAALTSVEVLKAGLSTTTIFLLDQNDLAKNGSVIGSASTDLLATSGTTLDLSATKLTSIEILDTTNTHDTTFTVNQIDLLKGGQVWGNAGNDTLKASGVSLDLSNTKLSSIEILQAGTGKATTFTVDAEDLAGLHAIKGSSGSDTLIVKDANIALGTVNLSSIETLKAGSTFGTTFSLGDTVGLKAVVGTAKSDTLTFMHAEADLSAVALTGIETLRAGSTDSTQFTVNQADLAHNGAIIGSTSAGDSIFAAGSSLDLTSTTLTGIEMLAPELSSGTVYKLTGDQAAGFDTLWGSNGADSLIVMSNYINLSAVTQMEGIDTVKSGLAGATTFTFRVGQLGEKSGFYVSSVVGGSGVDSLTIAAATVDVSRTALTSIERLIAWNGLGATSAEFVVSQFDLAKGGSIVGTGNTADAVIAAGSSLDLTSTTLTGIEHLETKYGNGTQGTVFTLTSKQLPGFTDITGSSATDTLVIKSSSFDVTSSTLSLVDTLKSGVATATTFLVDANQLGSGGGAVTSIVGGTGKDTLTVAGQFAYVDKSVALSSIEILRADATNGTHGTVFGVNQSDLAAGGSIIGNVSAKSDLVLTDDTTFDLTSTTLTSVELVQAHSDNSTTFTLTAAQVKGLEIDGNLGSDTLMIRGTTIDLTSTELQSIENLTAGSSAATTFIADLSDVDFSTVNGNKGIDTLTVIGTDFDLSHAGIASIEKLKSVAAGDTKFTLDQADLPGLTSISGSTGHDSLLVKSSGTTVDLSSVTLTSIETIETSTTTGAVRITLGAGENGATLDLLANGKVDTVAFAAGYKVTSVSNDTAILSHTLTVDHFGSSDVLDVSALSHGTPMHATDITGMLGNPATLKAALNLAAAGNGNATADVVTFQYGGDTYALVDNSAGKTLTAADAVIKLVGTHTLSDANFVF